MNLLETFFKARFLLNLVSMNNMDKKLRNIANGLVSPSSVSVVNVKECGNKILAEMVGYSPLSYKYKRSMQAVQMPAKKDSKSSKSKSIDIDPDLLFQRILSLCTTEEQMRDAFSHDLAHHPPSLFTDDVFLRTGKKSSLCKSIVEDYSFCDVTPNIQIWDCVLDGGYLLRAIEWVKGSTYKEIIKGYHSFVNGIGSQVFIVFDGYLKSKTKDQTHEKRYPIQSLRIEITEDMTSDCSKDLFLGNPANKQQFINMLGERVSSAGYKVTLHANDADVVLVDQVIELSKDRNVRVISDDTDVCCFAAGKTA